MGSKKSIHPILYVDDEEDNLIVDAGGIELCEDIALKLSNIVDTTGIKLKFKEDPDKPGEHEVFTVTPYKNTFYRP